MTTIPNRRQMASKYGGTCAGCGKSFPKWADIVYDYDTRKAYHVGCEPALTADQKQSIEDKAVAAYVAAGLGEW